MAQDWKEDEVKAFDQSVRQARDSLLHPTPQPYHTCDAFQKGAHVKLRGTREHGVVTNVREDDRGEKIYTVRLDNESYTPTGLMVAREMELE